MSTPEEVHLCLYRAFNVAEYPFNDLLPVVNVNHSSKHCAGSRPRVLMFKGDDMQLV